MKWSRYPQYKDSGIEWLGEIPEDWDVKECKFGYSIQLGKMLQNKPNKEEDMLIPYLKAQNVLWERTSTESLPEMWASKEDLIKYGVMNGDLLVCEGGEVGRASILDDVPIRCIIQNALHRVRPKKGNQIKYLMYLLEVASFNGWFDILCSKATIAHFTWEKFGWFHIISPTLSEQQAITAFLDLETSRIDKLIEKKEKQIELLKEKRAALISHAVTKGLDPNVKMKDSGIQWLGEIPEEWELKRLKFLLSEPLKYGANESAEFDDPNCPRYVRITDISDNGYLREETFKSLPEDIARSYILNEGDLLFARSGATVGKTFLYLTSWGRASYAGYLIRARLNKSEYLPTFAVYFCRSNNYLTWLKSIFIQATIQNVSAEKYANLIFPVPTLEEQKKIASFLDNETGKIDTLVEKVQKSIELLKEYRTAIISAAVTGKIDVRGTV